MVSMQGKNAVVFGLRNKRSIAWAIAQCLHAAGTKLAITYENERLREDANELVASLPGAEAFQCDVSSDRDIESLFAQLKERFGRLDALAHCIAFAPPDDLRGDFLNTSREGFRIAHDISVYSLIAVTRGVAPLMTEGGSVITLTYFGAEKVVPGYNIMGVAKASLEASVRYLAHSLGPKNIRVNAISAGPIKTLASRGVSDFSLMLKNHAEHSPLKRNVDAKEVGDTALFLCSPLSTAVTGETLYVDCGYNIMGF
jgi:enoyl-[acyl-carrier protein] reductase I